MGLWQTPETPRDDRHGSHNPVSSGPCGWSRRLCEPAVVGVLFVAQSLAFGLELFDPRVTGTSNSSRTAMRSFPPVLLEVEKLPWSVPNDYGLTRLPEGY